MKKSSLAAGLEAAAKPTRPETSTSPKQPGTVLIGAHFAPEVRRTLLLVQAEKQNSGKNLKQILGEAINDVCAKYGKPEPYRDDSE